VLIRLRSRCKITRFGLSSRETGIKRQTNERAGAAARAREEPSPAFAKERTQNAPVSSFPGVPVCNCVQAFRSPDRSLRRYTDQNVPNDLQAPEGLAFHFANKLLILQRRCLRLLMQMKERERERERIKVRERDIIDKYKAYLYIELIKSLS